MSKQITEDDISGVKIHFPKTVKVIKDKALVCYAELVLCDLFCLSSISVYQNIQTNQYSIAFPGKEFVDKKDVDNQSIKSRYFCCYYPIREYGRLLLLNKIIEAYKIELTKNN
jgi:hypothetical protein